MTTLFDLTEFTAVDCAVGGRVENDHYPTPSWMTLALMDRIGSAETTTYLEPAAGEDQAIGEI